jgi:hypothetical protein
MSNKTKEVRKTAKKAKKAAKKAQREDEKVDTFNRVAKVSLFHLRANVIRPSAEMCQIAGWLAGLGRTPA